MMICSQHGRRNCYKCHLGDALDAESQVRELRAAVTAELDRRETDNIIGSVVGTVVALLVIGAILFFGYLK